MYTRTYTLVLRAHPKAVYAYKCDTGYKETGQKAIEMFHVHEIGRYYGTVAQTRTIYLGNWQR
jgi:hypothetical protein